MRATPDLDTFATEQLDIIAAAAQDAAFMIILLLQFMKNGGSGYGKRIASFARDTIDTYVQAKDRISPADPNLEQRIAEHPLMLHELSAQKRDLERLEKLWEVSQLEKFREDAQFPLSNISLMPPT